MPASREFECRLENLEAAIDAFRDAVAEHVKATKSSDWIQRERWVQQAAEDEAAARTRLLQLF